MGGWLRKILRPAWVDYPTIICPWLAQAKLHLLLRLASTPIWHLRNNEPSVCKWTLNEGFVTQSWLSFERDSNDNVVLFLIFAILAFLNLCWTEWSFVWDSVKPSKEWKMLQNRCKCNRCKTIINKTYSGSLIFESLNCSSWLEMSIFDGLIILWPLLIWQSKVKYDNKVWKSMQWCFLLGNNRKKWKHLKWRATW